MGTLQLEHQLVEYQWASDVSFDGIRLEVLSNSGDVICDVCVSENGSTTVNTFGKEVGADVLVAAIKVALQPR